jgi:hypothetical protein
VARTIFCSLTVGNNYSGIDGHCELQAPLGSSLYADYPWYHGPQPS